MSEIRNENVVELFWYGLERVKTYDLDVGSSPSYLFQATEGKDAFVELSIDLARLNNYVRQLGVSLKWDEESDPSLEQTMDAAGIEDDEERALISYFQGQYPLEMADFIKTASAANALVIIYFWFIKSLKDVCRWAEPSLYHDKVKAREFHRFEIGTILDILDANTDGLVTKEVYKGRIKIVMEAVQQLRNDYAHGNWDQLRTHIQQLRLMRVFETMSGFFGVLEQIVEENYDDPKASTKLL